MKQIAPRTPAGSHISKEKNGKEEGGRKREEERKKEKS